MCWPYPTDATNKDLPALSEISNLPTWRAHSTDTTYPHLPDTQLGRVTQIISLIPLTPLTRLANLPKLPNRPSYLLTQVTQVAQSGDLPPSHASTTNPTSRLPHWKTDPTDSVKELAHFPTHQIDGQPVLSRFPKSYSTYLAWTCRHVRFSRLVRLARLTWPSSTDPTYPSEKAYSPNLKDSHTWREGIHLPNLPYAPLTCSIKSFSPA